MTNKQLTPKVKAWLKSTDVAPEDVRRSVGIVSGRAEHARQRGRWWPLPSFRRTPGRPSSETSSHLQPNPIAATAGPTPVVTGRTRSMLSPVKAITAAALVFGIGGVLLFAQPYDQSGQSVPGATMDVEPAWVTGSINWAGTQCSDSTAGPQQGRRAGSDRLPLLDADVDRR